MSDERKPRDGWTATLRMIWNLPVGTMAKAVLGALLSYADKEGVCWPSLGRLADDVSGSKAGVKRALKQLVKKQVVERRSQRGPGGVRRYVISDVMLKIVVGLDAMSAQAELIAREKAATAQPEPAKSSSGVRRSALCELPNDPQRTIPRERSEVAGAESKPEAEPRTASEALAKVKALLQATTLQMPGPASRRLDAGRGRRDLSEPSA